jgi:hypothetical protein
LARRDQASLRECITQFNGIWPQSNNPLTLDNIEEKSSSLQLMKDMLGAGESMAFRIDPSDPSSMFARAKRKKNTSEFLTHT